jgi:ATP-dependent 26S proteasome regulatory subunit
MKDPKDMDQPPNPIWLMIANRSLPLPHRAALLRDILEHMDPTNEALVKHIFDQLAEKPAEAAVRDKERKLAALLKEIQEGPMRIARFVELARSNGGETSQALVILEDGTHVYAVVHDEKAAEKLRRGDRVVVDGKARVLFRGPCAVLKAGEEARFERKIDDGHIEVAIRGEERAVVIAPADLMDQVAAGEVQPGASVVLNSRQGMAVAVLPAQDGLSHFRFLDKTAVPDVMVERDIGAPPKLIREVADHIRDELLRPETRRRYRLRPCLMKILCGVSGSGKTLAIQAIHRLMYQIMSEATGAPLEQLPARVFRFRQSQMLSMWLGESDKNVDRLFDEIEKLAGDAYTAPDGRTWRLPVLVIIEEADGMARSRGSGADPVYDRILTTILQRLDPNREGLRDKLVIFLATTNESHIVDPAFLRRVGGSIEVFGRLKRSAFKAVLQKHVTRLPAASNNGYTQPELWTRMTDDLAAWLYSPNGDQGIVELTYAGSTTPVVKCRRDFLTGALIDRAVQQAATEACAAEERGVGVPGVTLEHLMRAINDQVLGIAGQLREHNAGSYLDLPDNTRVASIRRLPQPAHLPIEFERHPNH